MGRRGGEGDQTEEALLQGPPALQALPRRPQAPRGAGARGQDRRALRRRRRGEEEAAQGRAPLRPPARALAPRSPSGRPFVHHLAGAFVLAQPEEARLEHPAGGGPLREADLRDELRADPVHPRGARLDRLVERRRWNLQRLEPRAQRHERRRVDPRAHLARVAQRARLVVADQQRAEAEAGALRFGEAADDDLLLQDALELEPVARAPAAVGRVRALGDQALPSRRAGALVGVAARAWDRGADPERGPGHHGRRERGVALVQRPRPQVLAVQPQQVERPQRRAAVALQRLEAPRLAVLPHGDHLPVDDRVAQRRDRSRDSGKREREPVARAQDGRAALDDPEAAHAVELALQPPVVAEVALPAERGEHRLDPVGTRHAGGRYPAHAPAAAAAAQIWAGFRSRRSIASPRDRVTLSSRRALLVRSAGWLPGPATVTTRAPRCAA